MTMYRVKGRIPADKLVAEQYRKGIYLPTGVWDLGEKAVIPINGLMRTVADRDHVLYSVDSDRFRPLAVLDEQTFMQLYDPADPIPEGRDEARSVEPRHELIVQDKTLSGVLVAVRDERMSAGDLYGLVANMPTRKIGGCLIRNLAAVYQVKELLSDNFVSLASMQEYYEHSIVAAFQRATVRTGTVLRHITRDEAEDGFFMEPITEKSEKWGN